MTRAEPGSSMLVEPTPQTSLVVEELRMVDDDGVLLVDPMDGAHVVTARVALHRYKQIPDYLPDSPLSEYEHAVINGKVVRTGSEVWIVPDAGVGRACERGVVSGVYRDAQGDAHLSYVDVGSREEHHVPLYFCCGPVC